MNPQLTDVEKQIEAAYDFRGHVTLTLDNDELVEGYIFNRVFSSPKIKEPSFIEVFPKGSDASKKIAIASVKSVALTGEDCAAGNSYEDYLKKKKEKQKV